MEVFIMLQPDAVSRHFLEHSYAVLRPLLEPTAGAFYYQSALRSARSGTMALNDRDVPGTPSAYGDPVMELLLEEMVPCVEQASGRKVFPTYAYFRVYKSGDVLLKHTDRPSCGLSLTL